MAQTPLPSPLKPDDLEAIFGTDDEFATSLAEGDAAPPPRRRVRRSVSLTERLRRLPKWVLFLAGLAIGWLVIGWVIWPVHWSNSDPWEMTAKNQKAFVQLVADRYWSDRDLAQAEATLGSWNRNDVNSLLVAMQAETIDVEARQRLDALTQALKLPGGEQSLLASIFGQEGVLIALLIATLPIFMAVGLVVSSRLNAKSAAEDEGEEPAKEDGEAELEELLADVQLEAGQAVVLGPDGTPVQPAGPGGELTPEQQEEAKEEEEASEEGPDPNNPLGDLASLFAEEDTSVAQLELLSKGMPDINIDELLGKMRDVLRRFHEERPRH